MTADDRTSPAARIGAAAAVVGGWLAVAALTWPGSAGEGRRIGGAAESPVHAAAPLAIGPITFFNTSCGGCHGDYGMLLRERLDGESARWDVVRHIISDMVTGQARATLPEREIDALTAYRLSLLDGSPFLALTGAAGGELRGEATPGAAVVLLVGGAEIPCAVGGHTWAAPAPTAQGPITIRATLHGRSTHLSVPGAAFGPERGR